MSDTLYLIEGLTTDERTLLHNVVNNPPAGQGAIPPAIASARQSLLTKIIDKGKYVGGGAFDYSNVAGKDLIITPYEWKICLECFPEAAWPSVWHKIEGDKLEERIKNAQVAKKQKELTAKK